MPLADLHVDTETHILGDFIENHDKSHQLAAVGRSNKTVQFLIDLIESHELLSIVKNER
jgi:hypothetical protein